MALTLGSDKAAQRCVAALGGADAAVGIAGRPTTRGDYRPASKPGHLHRILTIYLEHDNASRPHRGLTLDVLLPATTVEQPPLVASPWILRNAGPTARATSADISTDHAETAKSRPRHALMTEIPWWRLWGSAGLPTHPSRATVELSEHEACRVWLLPRTQLLPADHDRMRRDRGVTHQRGRPGFHGRPRGAGRRTSAQREAMSNAPFAYLAQGPRSTVTGVDVAEPAHLPRPPMSNAPFGCLAQVPRVTVTGVDVAEPAHLPRPPMSNAPFGCLARVPRVTVTGVDVTEVERLPQPRRLAVLGAGGPDVTPAVALAGGAKGNPQAR